MAGTSLSLDRTLDRALLEEDDAAHEPPTDAASGQRLRAMVQAHHAFLWRSLRRLGVAEAEVDDVAQQAWLVIAKKLSLIAVGAEKRFLFAVALRVASAHRRLRARHSGVTADIDVALEDPSPRADELLDREHARRAVDRILDEMPIEIRAVFVLNEVEELTGPEIAELLEIPLGTVASRLRRGRALFEEKVMRHQLRSVRGASK